MKRFVYWLFVFFRSSRNYAYLLGKSPGRNCLQRVEAYGVDGSVNAYEPVSFGISIFLAQNSRDRVSKRPLSSSI